MIKKCKISSINTIKKTARVFIEDMNNSVSYELDIAQNLDINDFVVGNYVLVAFYGQSLGQGIIIALLRR